MSYMRGPSYIWRDDHHVHIWAEDGYDGWADVGWSEGRKHSVPDSAPYGEAMRLFNAIVVDVWKGRRAGLSDLREQVQRRLQAAGDRMEALERAFIFEKRIDQTTYERQRDKLREESTLLEIELYHTRSDELDVEGLLAFAEDIVTDASRIWFQAIPEQKTRLQRVFFPEGLSFDGNAFGTAVTCLAFSELRENRTPENGLASPARLTRTLTDRFRLAA